MSDKIYRVVVCALLISILISLLGILRNTSTAGSEGMQQTVQAGLK